MIRLFNLAGVDSTYPDDVDILENNASIYYHGNSIATQGIGQYRAIKLQSFASLQKPEEMREKLKAYAHLEWDIDLVE